MRNIVKLAKPFYFIISVFTIILCVIIGYYYVKLPDKFYLSSNCPSDAGSLNINSFIQINTNNKTDIPVSAAVDINTGEHSGQSEDAEIKLFGMFPVKDVKLERIDRPVLVPCGIPFGIKIFTDGAVVTGFGEVEGEDAVYCPAQNGLIICGDVIKTVNGKLIEKNSDISKAVQLNKEKTVVTLLRDGNDITVELKPVKSKTEGIYKIGVWVRDCSAGIGTITYFDPQNSVFGGLGHGVCDVDTGRMLPLLKGEAVSVSISNVIKGRPGNPGELCGSFLSRVPIGIIENNTETGVFGTMNYAPTLENGLPMAFKQEVQIGPAKILATLSGSSPREYDILIEKIDYDESNQVKNMIIRVTDSELLSRAGGIVQGMSGSPIIQNNMLAGAVTHVFINDTTRGYAIFAENMYRTSCELNQNANKEYPAA